MADEKKILLTDDDNKKKEPKQKILKKKPSKFVTASGKKGVWRMHIKNAENPKDREQQQAVKIKFALETLVDWRVWLINKSWQELRAVDIILSTFRFVITETRRTFDLIKEDMIKEWKSHDEVEDLMYGLIIHDMTAIQMSMYDVIKAAYPEISLDKLEKEYATKREKLLDFIMKELDKFYESIAKKNWDNTSPEDLDPIEK